MNEHTDMRIENHYAQNVYGSPNYVESPEELEAVQGTRETKPTLTLKKMLEATEQGLTRAQTASMAGLTYRQVAWAENKYKNEGVKLRTEKTGIKTDTKEKAKIFLERGELSVREIGKELGVSPQRIHQIKAELKEGK